MGCDIHGYWELYHPHFKRWIAFRSIDGGRSYTWFGILSGVRGSGPHVASIEDAGPSFRSEDSRVITEEQITSEDEDFSLVWCRYVAQWGQDLHSFTVVPYDEVRKANAILSVCRLRDVMPDQLSEAQLEELSDGVSSDEDELRDPDEEPIQDREPLPDPNDIIDRLILDVKRDAEWEEHYKQLPMNIPLGEIIGTYDPKEVAKLVRMVVAYDN